MSLAAGTRLGPYEVLGLIGAGGMGEVYRARDTRLDRTVAIKVLPPQFSADPDRRARFEPEAKTIAGLTHPNICTLHDVGTHPSTGSAGSPQAGSGQAMLYLVMEHLAGETLAARLRRGPLPLPQALEIAAQIAEALDAAHKHGIVHRDLKPGNVMLATSGTGRSGVSSAKLLDFGLAKLAAHGEHPALSADGWFTVAASLPAALTAPTLVSPTGSTTVATAQPTYQWGAVAGAEEYYLWVSNGGQVRIGQWFTAAAAGCGGGTGTCSLTPGVALAAGTVRWEVKAWSQALGHGPWSADGWFTVM